MRRWRWWLLVSLLVWMSAQAADQPAAAAGDKTIMAYGKADGAAPGWAIVTLLPGGWTGDCCHYAKAIGVNEVIYRGTWTGKPERVMVLNVWPRKLPTLAAEWRADRKHYLSLDPRAKVKAFAVDNSSMRCHGMLYQGSDHVDDAVVFCDPGKITGIRYSWSMTIAANDPQRQKLVALFRQVVKKSLYMTYQKTPGSAAGRGPH